MYYPSSNNMAKISKRRNEHPMVCLRHLNNNFLVTDNLEGFEEVVVPSAIVHCNPKSILCDLSNLINNY